MSTLLALLISALLTTANSQAPRENITITAGESASLVVRNAAFCKKAYLVDNIFSTTTFEPYKNTTCARTIPEKNYVAVEKQEIRLTLGSNARQGWAVLLLDCGNNFPNFDIEVAGINTTGAGRSRMEIIC
ncbi:Hypothetical protein D9617_93g092340 [Elsinoe fawcettii]|nr:Hypothetical protein D9617_93g092340 [Elsinoe fawcettii]